MYVVACTYFSVFLYRQIKKDIKKSFEMVDISSVEKSQPREDARQIFVKVSKICVLNS